MRANSVGLVPAISRIAGIGRSDAAKPEEANCHVYDEYGGRRGRLFTLMARFSMPDIFAGRAALRRLTGGTAKVTS
jgi:hypothetical protein